MYTIETLAKAIEDLLKAYVDFRSLFIDSAIKEMNDTVIAEIKQDSKDYISDELKTQQQNLELAIEQTKQEVNNYIAEEKSDIESFNEQKKQEIQDLIINAESLIANNLENMLTQSKKEIKSTLITFFQSTPWIQYPDLELPDGTIIHFPRPADVLQFEGYRWIKLPWDGLFFRTTGKNALPFNTGVQGDAIRNIKGYIIHDGSWNMHFGQTNNLFKTNMSSWDLWDVDNNYHSKGVTSIDFDVSRILPTDNDNHPINKSTIHWLLVEE